MIERLRDWARSSWYGRPRAELEAWIDRGRALEEIKGTRGYALIQALVDKELQWATRELEICKEDAMLQLQMYIKALRLVADYIVTTDRNATIASEVLAGRLSKLDEVSGSKFVSQ